MFYSVLEFRLRSLSLQSTVFSKALEELIPDKNKIITLQDESLILEMERRRKHNQVIELLTKMERMQNMFN
jgi:hypothetical protein